MTTETIKIDINAAYNQIKHLSEAESVCWSCPLTDLCDETYTNFETCLAKTIMQAFEAIGNPTNGN